MNEMVIKNTPIEKLIPYARNPRKNDSVVDRMVSAIEEFGFRIPVLAKSDGKVIDGHLRIKAAKKLGMKDIPVIITDDMTDAQIKAFRLLANRSVNWAQWDNDLLKLELEELIGMDFNLELTGFDSSEIDSILKYNEGLTDPDDVPELNENPLSKPGDIWLLGDHRIMCGNSRIMSDVAKLMNGRKAEMVFTDPPYNVDYSGGMSGDGHQHKRSKIANDKMSSESFYEFLYDCISNMMSFTSGAFYICMSSSELHNLWKAFTDAGGHWQTYCIWAKHAFTLSRSDYQHQFEPILYGLSEEEAHKIESDNNDMDSLPIMYGWNKHDWYGGRKQGDVWMFDKPSKSKEHPTMKPVGLCIKAIGNSSRREQIVLDLFGGSGSTLIACEQINRICYMMEFERKYCDVIINRWQNFTGLNAILESSGKTYKEVLDDNRA